MNTRQMLILSANPAFDQHRDMSIFSNQGIALSRRRSTKR
jgi:hypothetical protein